MAEQSDRLPDRPMVRTVVSPKGDILSQPRNLILEEYPDIVIEDVLDDWPTSVLEQVAR